MKISAMGIGTSRDIEPSPNCWRKDCVVIRRSCDHELKDQLLDDLEIHPLNRRPVFLISQQISVSRSHFRRLGQNIREVSNLLFSAVFEYSISSGLRSVTG